MAYATQALDPQVATLPPGYVGHDIERFYNDHPQPAKSEFETEAPHRSRLAVPESFGTLAFLINSRGKDAGKPVVKYNAEKQQCEATIWAHYDLGLDDRFRHSTLLTKITTTEGSTSTQSNAFGATVQVTRWSTETYGLRLSAELPDIDVKIPLPAAKAQEVKDRIAFLAVASPARAKDGTLTSSSSEFKEATIDSPTTIITKNHYVSVGSLSIWVFDTTTGEVIQKIDIPKKGP